MGERFYICFLHDKRTFKSEAQAYRELKIINNKRDYEGEPLRVFYCASTGGYHHTSITRGELTKRQLSQTSNSNRHEHERFQTAQRRRGKSKKTRNRGSGHR